MRGVGLGLKEKHVQEEALRAKDRPKGEGKSKNTQSSNAFWDRRVGEGKEGGESKKAKCDGRRGRRSVTCGVRYQTGNTKSGAHCECDSSCGYLYLVVGYIYYAYKLYVPLMYSQSIPLFPRAISPCFVTVLTTPLSVTFPLIGGSSREGQLTALNCTPHRLRLHPFRGKA